MDHGNPHFHGFHNGPLPQFPALVDHLAFLGYVLAADDFHQGGFPSAILTADNMDLPG